MRVLLAAVTSVIAAASTTTKWDLLAKDEEEEIFLANYDSAASNAIGKRGNLDVDLRDGDSNPPGELKTDPESHFRRELSSPVENGEGDVTASSPEVDIGVWGADYQRRLYMRKAAKEEKTTKKGNNDAEIKAAKKSAKSAKSTEKKLKSKKEKKTQPPTVPPAPISKKGKKDKTDKKKNKKKNIAPAPTTAPAPSSTPSVSPSLTRTGSPSVLPSVSPSVSPSDSPTKSPADSLPPSDNPTISSQPSVKPSGQPTSFPTSSKNPTSTPSLSPSGDPSASPSANPAAVASGSPSLTPSEKGTSSPSDRPSKSPSISPSVANVASNAPSSFDGCRVGNNYNSTFIGAANAFPLPCGTSTCNAVVTGPANDQVLCNQLCSNLYFDYCDVNCIGPDNVCNSTVFYGQETDFANIVCTGNYTCQYSDFIYYSNVVCDGPVGDSYACASTYLYSDSSSYIDCNGPGYYSCGASAISNFATVDCNGESSCQDSNIYYSYETNCNGYGSCYNSDLLFQDGPVLCGNAYSCTGSEIVDYITYQSPSFQIYPADGESITVTCECRGVECNQGIDSDYNVACGRNVYYGPEYAGYTYMDVGPSGVLRCVGIKGCGRLTIFPDCSRVQASGGADISGIVDVNGNSC